MRTRLFEPHSIEELIRPLANPAVAASAGNAKVGNRINILTRWQALEYITTQNLDRRANALLNCITVVPGAVGAWRRSVVLSVGGFRPDTLAEDAELTVRLLKDKHHVVYADRAIAWTEAPEKVRDLFRQRFRWMFGTLQTAWKYRDLLFKVGCTGALGFIASLAQRVFIPGCFFFSGAFDGRGHFIFRARSFVLQLVVSSRKSFSGEEFQHTLFYYALFLALDLIASFVAFLLEPKREDWSLLLWLPWQRFYYRQLMYIIAIRAALVALKELFRRLGDTLPATPRTLKVLNSSRNWKIRRSFSTAKFPGGTPNRSNYAERNGSSSWSLVWRPRPLRLKPGSSTRPGIGISPGLHCLYGIGSQCRRRTWAVDAFTANGHDVPLTHFPPGYPLALAFAACFFQHMIFF